MTAMLQPIVERLEEKNAAFNPHNDTLLIWPKDDIDTTCHGVLNTLEERKLFGCTEQYDWHDSLNKNYIKPQSTTYLAQEWAMDCISNAEHHELSHLAIITIRQILKKNHQKRRKNPNTISLTDADFNYIMKELSKLDRDLDFMDKAYFDSSTNRIRINKKSDVMPKLEELVDIYIWGLQNGGHLR